MAENNRFKMLAYSGQEINSGWWGRLVLSVDGMRTPDRLPSLREHLTTRPTGVIDSIMKSQGQLSAGGYFLDTRDGRECRDLIKNGYPMQASVGVWPESISEVKEGEEVLVNGRNFTGPGVIWAASFVREISMTSIGADSGTSVAIAASAAMRTHTMGKQPEDFDSFDSAVHAMLKAGNDPRTAIKETALRFPDLYRGYLSQFSRGHYEMEKSPDELLAEAALQLSLKEKIDLATATVRILFENSDLAKRYYESFSDAT